MATQTVLQPGTRLPTLIFVARVKQIATWTTRKAELCRFWNNQKLLAIAASQLFIWRKRTSASNG
jgi:hypothetical protein